VILPNRLSILADGAAAALLAFAIDRAAAWTAGRRAATAAVAALALVAVVPLVPRPLPAQPADPVPTGWTRAVLALRLPPYARVLAVPVPTPTVTYALRWQADTGVRVSLIGGYFEGPAWNGHAYIEGNGLPPLVYYLDDLWFGAPQGPAPPAGQVAADLKAWAPAAVVAAPGSPLLRRYLVGIFGQPTISYDGVLAWRLGR
jgi:hypothetical protein